MQFIVEKQISIPRKAQSIETEVTRITSDTNSLSEFSFYCLLFPGIRR